MTEREVIEVASRAVEIARHAGADEAEATVGHTRRFHVEARETELTKLEQSTGSTLSMRLISGGRRVSFATSDLSREALERMVAGALEQAREVTEDSLAGLPRECGGPGNRPGMRASAGRQLNSIYTLPVST